MPTITIPKKELKAVIKESVREVFEQELMKLRASLLPFVSQGEQKDIEKRYGKPVRQTAKSIDVEKVDWRGGVYK
ncbi:hypothetical protein L6279_03480 [Candidatus Parcubacteria bacterium]|nr:hypothetical protein [Patescibacteria group bacterium]MCG2693142.1 hypothetical protein [Candidatus Parcubacteria bacterium]